MARVAPLPRGGRGWAPSPALLTGLAVLVLAIAILAYTGALARITGQNAAPATYATATVSRDNLTVSVVGTGPVAANVNVPLSFKESGKLTAIKVDVGDKVTRGQVLATLDTPDLQIALEQAKASLAQAQANLAKVQAGASPSQIAVAQTSLDNAKRSAADAQDSLASTRAATDTDVQAARNSVASAIASRDVALATLAAAKDQEAKTLAADQATIDYDRKNLNATKETIAANQVVLLQQIEQAKDSLYAAQVARDQACARPNAGCESQNASVLTSETALNTVNAQYTYSQKQSAQTFAQAQNALDQATNQLASDKAKLDAAVTTAGLQEKQAELAVTAAQNGLTQAQVKAGQSIQSAQTQAHSATNAVQSAQASYNQTVAPPLATDLESARAQVTSAQAAVDQAQLNLDDATLVAPFDGTIAAINGSLEQWVTGGAPGITSTSGGSAASATAIMTLFDLNSLQVTVQVNEADIGKVKVGDPVSFRVSAFPTLKFSGKVRTIQPVGTTSANVVSYNVTCSIQSVDGATLYPGMTATTTIVTAQRSNVLLVPNTALSFAQTALQQGLIAGGPGSAGPNAGTVAVLEGTRLVAKPVTLGVEGATQTEVLSGLKAGDTVVVGGSGTISSNTGAGNPGGRGGIMFRG